MFHFISCPFHQRSGVFRRIILKCDNEPSTKSLEDAVIQACAGVEVIPQALMNHMAMGRVEMAVRERMN